MGAVKNPLFPYLSNFRNTLFDQKSPLHFVSEYTKATTTNTYKQILQLLDWISVGVYPVKRM